MPEIEVGDKINEGTENIEQSTDTVTVTDKNLNVEEKPKRGRKKKLSTKLLTMHQKNLPPVKSVHVRKKLMRLK